MNKRKIAILLVCLAFVFVFVMPVCADILGVPVSKSEENIALTIEENTGTYSIGGLLKEKGLIRSKIAFVAFVKASEFSGRLGSGSYELSPSMTMAEICRVLCAPKDSRKTVIVTFPEGYSAEQMGQKLENEGIVTKADFLSSLSDDYDFEFTDAIPSGEYRYALQGFLFPDTYEFYADSTAHEITERMLSRFNEVYRELGIAPKELFEIVIKASLVEKEAKLDSEREIVAGVIENRTQRGMPYQIDASVLYAATEGMYDREESAFIAQSIKNLDSPYNTYMYSGLPAGPICNPGYVSIKAALNPKEHDYLYYHTDTSKGDGSHIFTATLSEHISTMN